VYVRAAVAARAADPALRGDGYRTLLVTDAIVAFERGDGTRRSIVVANAGPEPADVVLPEPADASRMAELLTTDGSSPDLRPSSGGGVSVTLPARWAGIWRVLP